MSAIPTSAASAGGASFRVGCALNRTLRVFFAGWRKFAVLSAVPLAPVLLLNLFATQAPLSAKGGLALAGVLLQSLLGSAATGTCLFGAFQIMRGQRFSISDSFKAARGRLLTLIVAALAIGLSFALGLMAIFGPVLILAPLLGGTAFTGVAALVAFVVFAVLCRMLLVSWAVVFPAIVIERLGVGAAMRRSQSLTSGYRWPIFWLYLLVGIIAVFIVVLAAGLFAGIVRISASVAAYLSDFDILTRFAATVVAQAFTAVLSAVIHHDLCVVKEGVDIETLTGIFT